MLLTYCTVVAIKSRLSLKIKNLITKVKDPVTFQIIN